MSLLVAIPILGCAPSEPPILASGVSPVRVTSAKSWVGDVATDGQHLYWANYDTTTGRSTGTLLERAPLAGGDPQRLAQESHPPTDLAVFGDHLYWIYALAPLKRVPVAGGEPQILRERGGATCFDIDASGLYLIDNGDVMRLDPSTGAERRIAVDSFGDCPVLFGDEVFWTERKGIYKVSKEGGVPEKIVDASKPGGLVVFDGALYSCLSDRLTRIAADGTTAPVRDFCRGDGLVVGDGVHWFRSPYFEGWPATEKWRIAQVTKNGPVWLYDGLGISDPIRVGSELFWFARPHGAGFAWEGLKAPTP